MAHIRKRGKKWYIYYRVDGKVVGKSLQTTDQREARRKKRELEAELVRKRSRHLDPWGDFPAAVVNGTVTLISERHSSTDRRAAPRMHSSTTSGHVMWSGQNATSESTRCPFTKRPGRS